MNASLSPSERISEGTPGVIPEETPVEISERFSEEIPTDFPESSLMNL